MDEKEFQERTSRLEKIAKVLEKLPSEVRAGAFELIKEYVTGRTSGEVGKKPPHKTDLTDNEDDATFFGKFTHDKAAENAKLIAANHFRKYGSEPFSIEEIRKSAADVGITIPERVDMTFVQAKAKTNRLFVRAGHGKFRPTVHGEAYLKSTYSVKKGTRSRAKTSE